MEEPLALLYSLLAIGGPGAYIFVYWYRSSRQWIKRKLRTLARSPIADIAEGVLVRMIGTVRELDHTVIAPVSGERCVYYHVVVDRLYDGAWRRLADQAHGIPFILEDDTGHVYIDATRAMLTTKHVRFFPAARPDPVFDRFLISHGISLAVKENLRVHEMRIDIGETFTVMGSGVHDIDPKAAQPDDYRSARKTRLWFRGGKKYPLVMSDDEALR